MLVNLPDPARFAMHKLIVNAARKGGFRANSNKDLAQAAHLLDFLWLHRQAQLGAVVLDLLGRGRGWVSRFREGADALRRAYPRLEVGVALAGAIESGRGRKGQTKPRTSTSVRWRSRAPVGSTWCTARTM